MIIWYELFYPDNILLIVYNSDSSMEEKYSYEKIKDIADYIQSRTAQRPKLGT